MWGSLTAPAVAGTGAWESPIVGDNDNSGTYGRSTPDWPRTIDVVADLGLDHYVVPVSVQQDAAGNWEPDTADLQVALVEAAAAGVELWAVFENYQESASLYADLADWQDAFEALAGDPSDADSLLGLQNTHGILRGVVVHEINRDLCSFTKTTGCLDDSDITDLASACVDTATGLEVPFSPYIPPDDRLFWHAVDGYSFGAKESAVAPAGSTVTVEVASWTIPSTAAIQDGEVKFWYQDSQAYVPSGMAVFVELEDDLGNVFHLDQLKTQDGFNPPRLFDHDFVSKLVPGRTYTLRLRLDLLPVSGNTSSWLTLGLHDFFARVRYVDGGTVDDTRTQADLTTTSSIASASGWRGADASPYRISDNVSGLWVIWNSPDALDESDLPDHPGELQTAVAHLASELGHLDLHAALRGVSDNNFSSTGWYTWDPVQFGNVLSALEAESVDVSVYKAPLLFHLPDEGALGPYFSPDPGDASGFDSFFRFYYPYWSPRVPGLYQELESPAWSYDPTDPSDCNPGDLLDTIFVRDTKVKNHNYVHSVWYRRVGMSDVELARFDGSVDEGMVSTGCTHGAMQTSLVTCDPAVESCPSAVAVYDNSGDEYCMRNILAEVNLAGGTCGTIVLRTTLQDGLGTEEFADAHWLPVCLDGTTGISEFCDLTTWSYGSGIDLDLTGTVYDDWGLGIYDAL